MRVVHIITKARWGGAQRHVYDVALALRERGHEVAVWYGEPGELAERLSRAGVTTRHIPHLGREVRLGRDVRSLWELLRLLRKERPEVVHLHSSKAGFTGALAARLAGVPRVVFTAHNWAFAQPGGMLRRAFFWFLQGTTVLLTHRTIAVSRATAEALRFPGTRLRMRVIPNALPPSFPEQLLPRSRARARLAALAGVQPREDEVWFISLSELLPVKGVDVALRAFALLHQTAPTLPWRYLIVGEGAARAELESLARSLPVAPRVHFVGQVPHAATLLRGADVFLLPSRSEGLPYALLEALAAQLPVVATRVGGVAEAAPHAILLPPHDPRAFAEGIRQAAERAATQEILLPPPSPHAFDEMVDAIEEVYRASRAE